jgi:hypothetical protein
MAYDLKKSIKKTERLLNLSLNYYIIISKLSASSAIISKLSVSFAIISNSSIIILLTF